MKKVAVFDLDKTLFDGVSMSTFLFGYLIPNRKISGILLVKAILLVFGYSSKVIPHNRASEMTMKLSAEVLKGKRVSEVEQWQKNFFSKQHFFEYVPQLISLLKKHNYTIVVVSASLDPIVQACAQVLGVTAVGSTLKVDGGVYTGTIDRLVNQADKVTEVEKYKSKDSKLLVFGDSSGDIAMLKEADEAFVFEPSEKDVIRTAQKTGMHIVDRKTILSAVTKVL